MNWLRTVGHEIFGLFVDDGIFAVAIVVWLALLKLFAMHTTMASRWSGFLLFLGLLAILIESSLRFSRRRSK